MSHQNIASIKDASYQGCVSAERGLVIGKYLLNACPTFLDSISDEVKAEIEAGQMLRFHENNPPQYYKDGIPCESTTKGATKVDINVVMSFTQQQFGRLKSEDPVKHGIHKSWRDSWSTYKSNRMKDLKKYVRDAKDSLEGKVRERSATKDFAVWLKEDLAPMVKARAKTAKARGDTTVDDAVVNAIAKAIK
jgi:hypothetical protein